MKKCEKEYICIYYVYIHMKAEYTYIHKYN